MRQKAGIVKETLPLGRIAGIRVGLHWSVLVIVVLVALTLARGRFPSAHPGEAAWVYWALGIVTAVVFLVSLLAHELAHAVVARRNGVEVEGITLWMLGGVARLRGEAKDPGAELRIAGVGPLVSAAAAILFTGAAVWLEILAVPGLVVEAIAWLAAINFVLAVFNAVPAAPLDGGRVLRAFLWWRSGDRVRAALSAANAGRALGWFMLFAGFASVLVTGELGGLWSALIGWFLIAAATAEGREAQLRGALAGVAVRQVMTPAPVTVAATDTVEQLLSTMPFGLTRHSAFPVVSHDAKPVGLMTVARVSSVPVGARSATVVGGVMCPLTDVATAEPGEAVIDLLPRLESSAERRALVLDDGHLVGIVALSDITRAVSWLATAKRSGPVTTDKQGRHGDG
ncbi:site-2 protease family protein [Streptomyces sp. NBC_00191]|uniref:site-2 protease family protein n=1 Tax=Streptomyces sp. NBC_00191 TaxID=2975674 RepID=UPI0032483ADB